MDSFLSSLATSMNLHGHYCLQDGDASHVNYDDSSVLSFDTTIERKRGNISILCCAKGENEFGSFLGYGTFVVQHGALPCMTLARRYLRVNDPRLTWGFPKEHFDFIRESGKSDQPWCIIPFKYKRKSVR